MIVWEELPHRNVNEGFFVGSTPSVYRAKVPGGWLVATKDSDSGGVTFLPDPNHEWDGSSLP